MKIQLPNPNDFLYKEDQFWEQLELSIYHAKKSWEKIKKNYPEDNNDNQPWLSFSHKENIEKKLNEDEFLEDSQEISIEINEL